MEFSTPWNPSLKGRTCAFCILYDKVKDARPNSVHHPAWAKKTLHAELDKRPEARDAMWEGIQALWRLSLTEESGVINLNWRNLVSAWLVCIHWLATVTEPDGAIIR